MGLHTWEPKCEAVVPDSKGDLRYCNSKDSLKMNEELRWFCPVHYYEPSEFPVVEEPPYDPEQYGGYQLSRNP